mgnify:CR=1 FL=1
MNPNDLTWRDAAIITVGCLIVLALYVAGMAILGPIFFPVQ